MRFIVNTNKQNSPKIALVYDRVNTPYGGAEKVLEAINEIFPNASLFTSVYSQNKSNWAKKFEIKTTFLQKIKFLRENHKLIAFLMPFAFESLDLSNFDIIISITSAEAKGILTKPNQLHVCYLLTPTRYLYSHKEKYLKSKKILNFPIIKQMANLALNYLSWWDKAIIFRPDLIIPISNLIKTRTKKYYQINSGKVIYPTIINQKNFNIKINKYPDYYLCVSRLVDYKRVDLSIKAALEIGQLLVVVGKGEEKNNLIKLSGNSWIEKQKNETITSLFERAKEQNKKIIFTNQLNSDIVNNLIAGCKALLMPGEEDFGITALEASNFGKPVIVFYRSGVSELLIDGKNAVFIKKETTKEVVRAIKKINSLNFDKHQIKLQVSKFNKDKFKYLFKKEVLDSWKIFKLRS